MRGIRTLRLAVVGAAGLLLAVSLITQGSVAAGVVVAALAAAVLALTVAGVRRASAGGRRSRLELRKRAAAVAALAVLAALAAGWNFFVHNAELRSGAVATATGEVVDVDYRRRAPDVAVVRFPTQGGTSVVARMPVDRMPKQGSAVPVEYVPADPRKARIPGNWAPAYERLAVLAGGLLLAAVVAATVDAVRRMRRRARGARPPGISST